MKKTFWLVIFFVSLLMIVPSYAIVEGTNRIIKLNSNIYDELYNYDEVDCFEFELTKPGSLKIDFDFDIQGRYFVKLKNLSNNNIIQNLTFNSEVNTSSGRYLKSGNKIRLNEGIYQVSVSTNYSNHTDAEYKLKINFDSETSDSYEKEDNNTAKTSMIIDYNRKITGNLESSSDIDFYMIELDYPGTVELRLQHEKSAKYTATLYSENEGMLKQLQNTTFSSDLVSNQDYSIGISDKVRVPSGNYYIKVSNGSWSAYTDEDYILNVMYVPDRYGNYEEEPNDDVTNATFINESEEFNGNLSSRYDIDYYYISLWGDIYYVNMELPQDSEYNITIYKEENGKLKQISSNRISDNYKYIEVKDARGNYYIKISSSVYSNEDYIVKVLNEYEVHIPKTIKLEVNNQYMMIDGKRVAIDGNRGTKPVVINGRMLLPVSAIIESLGGNVNWNDETQVATFNLKGRIITLPIGSNIAYVDGEVKYLDVSTQTINGRTMAPIRFIAENLGCNVVWDNGIVTINY